MPAAAVIRRIRALSRIYLGLKGSVGGQLKSVVKVCGLHPKKLQLILGCLEYSRGGAEIRVAGVKCLDITKTSEW